MTSKYRAKPVTIDGIRYASQGEARRHADLKLLERAGLITDLRHQVAFELAPAVSIQCRKRPALKYLADFVYREAGREVVEDFKGRITEGYRIKRHLMKTVHNIEIRETRA